MTEEELEKEAEESFEQYKVTDEDYVVSPYSDDMGEKMLMYNDEYYAEETYLRFYTQGYLAGAEPREKRIAELEKENAELKEKYVKNITDCDICDTYCNSQLTKAKELLKKLYEETRGYMNDQGFDMNVINEVYDFIKSEVEK